MNRIKEVLEQKNIKQIWLAEQLGKSYTMVNSYVQNRRQPSLKTLFEIAKILKVEARALIKEEINEPLISQTKTKNKWLYPADEFGKMEEGVVEDSKTYRTYITKDEIQQEFIIINK
jgi:putative transcriptional regulator